MRSGYSTKLKSDQSADGSDHSADVKSDHSANVKSDHSADVKSDHSAE